MGAEYMGGQPSGTAQQQHHTATNMKFLAMILFLGVASASPQGLGGVNIGGQGGGFGQSFLPRGPTNTRQGTCGQFSAKCYGQGLETVGAMFVNPFSVQCIASAVSRINKNYLVRVDFNGEIDVRPTGFNLAAQQQAFNEQLQIETLQNQIEL